MYIPKKYGQSKTEKCPFCGKLSTTENFQGVPVCRDHKDSELEGMKCVCGSYLDIMKGKYGVFFNCLSCGNMNLRKVLEINDVKIKDSKGTSAKENKKENGKVRETTVRSDDPRYF